MHVIRDGSAMDLSFDRQAGSRSYAQTVASPSHTIASACAGSHLRAPFPSAPQSKPVASSSPPHGSRLRLRSPSGISSGLHDHVSMRTTNFAATCPIHLNFGQ